MVQCQRFARTTDRLSTVEQEATAECRLHLRSHLLVRLSQEGPVVLKHFVSVDDAFSDHALAIQLIASTKVISLQSSETLSNLSILLKSDRSKCFLNRALKARRIP